MSDETMLRFGCGHIKRDPEIHEATWGARLIYSEVIAGGSGVVFDRQTPEGEPEKVRELFPVIERATAEFRKAHYSPGLTGDGGGRFVWREGKALVVMSPQQSYGYLYITAVLEREEGSTPLVDFSFESGKQHQSYGNWPPHIVAEREAREAAARREAALSAVPFYERDLRWAESDLRSAEYRGKSQRYLTTLRNKVNAAQQKLDAARIEAAKYEEVPA